MPVKNTVREFEENGIYHVYNRGLNKSEIFRDSDDYRTFLYYLASYLLPLNKALTKYPDLPARLYSKNLSSDVELLVFCLMPNHFHLLLKTKTKSGISQLVKQLTNAYLTYFNKKYGREGPIMQGVYKCVAVKDQLINLSRYIHLNPTTAFLVNNPKDYKWSSYNEYLQNQSEICNLDIIMSQFLSWDSWKKFMADQKDYSKSLILIQQLTLES